MSKIPVFDPTRQGIIHPEQQEHEVYLGDFDPGFAERSVTWETKRIGITAYQEDGSPYPETILREYRPVPVFADRGEVLEHHYAMIHGKE